MLLTKEAAVDTLYRAMQEVSGENHAARHEVEDLQ
jgi:hypothetical protein